MGKWFCSSVHTSGRPCGTLTAETSGTWSATGNRLINAWPTCFHILHECLEDAVNAVLCALHHLCLPTWGQSHSLRDHYTSPQNSPNEPLPHFTDGQRGDQAFTLRQPEPGPGFSASARTPVTHALATRRAEQQEGVGAGGQRPALTPCVAAHRWGNFRIETLPPWTWFVTSVKCALLCLLCHRAVQRLNMFKKCLAYSRYS